MLDRFQLRRQLQSGQGGEVWEARDDTGAPVVVKVAFEPSAVARLKWEDAAVARLDHPHLVRRLDGGSTPFGWALVVDLVVGSTLEQALRIDPPAVAVAVGWARQLCAALTHLHAKGVVHRDVSAENIVVGRTEAGRPNLVLLDLGLGVVDGKAESPDTETVDGRADLYALGVLLYRMLAGCYPFDPADPGATEPPPLGQVNPDLRLPAGLEAAVLRCLSKAPGARYATAEALDEVLAALEFVPQRDWVRATGFDLSMVPDTPPPAPQRRSGDAIWFLVAVIGILAVLAWLL